MPYAHLWAGGTKPYLEQWYEYPPATIPVFYIPHVVDMFTRFKIVHLNYLDAYRGELLLWDITLFALIWLSLKKLNVRVQMIWIALAYYIIVTTKAHDFIYDTMDLTFATAMTLGVAAPILLTGLLGQTTSWFGFFLATCLKYVNAPLAPIYTLIERKNLKQTIIAGSIGFLLVWAVPLGLFRSSILVSLVYQNIRGIQIDSAPAILIRTANIFTKSEHVIEVYKNYEIAGPITDQAKSIMKLFFPASVAAFLAGSAWYILKHPKMNADWLRIYFTVGYVLVFFLTGKVLSTPFLIWQIPLFALFPFKRIKHQIIFLSVSAVSIFATMTKTSNDAILMFPIPLLMGWIRTLSFLSLFIMWIKFGNDQVQEENIKLLQVSNKKSKK